MFLRPTCLASISTSLKKSYGWPGIVVREQDQIISKYVIKKLDKIKKNFLNIVQW